MRNIVLLLVVWFSFSAGQTTVIDYEYMFDTEMFAVPQLPELEHIPVYEYKKVYSKQYKSMVHTPLKIGALAMITYIVIDFIRDTKTNFNYEKRIDELQDDLIWERTHR